MIQLRGLRVVALIGVLPEERERPQPLELDLDLSVDLTAASSSDDLADTVDYGAVCEAAVAVADAGHVQLLEALAGRVADAVLACDNRIDAVEVAVRKLRPPVPHDLTTAGVRLTRRR